MEREYGNKSSNSLSLIRLLAAFQVMFGHIFEHLELPIDTSIVYAAYFLRGVPIFFGISGFLIWFSIGRSSTYQEYIKKRFWRIYPELWVAVLVEIIVMIILYREWSFKSLLVFSICQSTFLQFWTPDSLRGYGVGTPNGALWTIGVMIQFYIIAWFTYKFMKRKKLLSWIVGFVLLFSISWSIKYFLELYVNNEIISKLYDQTIIRYLWIFYIGMFIARFLKWILPIIEKYWYIALVLAVMFYVSKFDIYAGYYLHWTLFLIFGLIGFSYRFPNLQIKTDISYSMFLYHMIIVNIFVEFDLIKSWFWSVISVFITIIVSILSTKTIGKLSIKMKEVNTYVKK